MALRSPGPISFLRRKPVTEVQAAVTAFTVAAIESDEHTASPANPLYFPFEFVAVHAV
jgi:hypothetical protein